MRPLAETAETAGMVEMAETVFAFRYKPHTVNGAGGGQKSEALNIFKMFLQVIELTESGSLLT